MDLEFCGLFTLCQGWNSFPITWTVAQSDDSGNGSGEKAQNYDAALTMSAFCFLTALFTFLISFLLKEPEICILQRKRADGNCKCHF